MQLKTEMFELLKRLFPINRSLSGAGVRETLKILQEYIPLKIFEVPTGTQVFDWVVPKEWNIHDACVKNEKGERIIDFNKSNLHVLGYSMPFEGTVDLEELKKHLYTLPDQPNLVPYITSYYKEKWGFCLAHNDYLALNEEKYNVKIDSSLEFGNLTYGELIIKGRTSKEILLSTYICHPSMANNELSGPIVTTFLAKHILESNELPYYTYRIVFIPETIGAIIYLSTNKDEMINNVYGGYVLTCVGDPGPLSYLKTRNGNTITDRISLHVLNYYEKFEKKIYDFIYSSSDERQYNSPGIDLAVGSIMRSKYGTFPEYHTSGDNLNFVTGDALLDTLEVYKLCLEIFERNHFYKVKVLCEPQLGKRELYPTTSLKADYHKMKRMKNLISYCDGESDLLSIAEKIESPIWELFPIVDVLLKHDLIEKLDK